jgi:Inner membrane component of T3SS, periplasmic domain
MKSLHAELPAPSAGRSARLAHLALADGGRSGAQPALVLRVLNGVQSGAQARIRHQRLLVGSMMTECDVVLDVGRPEPHACLVRVSQDGWSVLAIVGDLWVGESWVPPQQTRDIVSGDVLSLGEVSFCVANTATIQWGDVHPPANKQAPRANPAVRLAVPQAPTVEPSPWAKLGRKPKAARTPNDKAPQASVLAPIFWGVLLLCALGLAAAGAYLFWVQTHPPQSPVLASQNALQDAKALVAREPWGRDLTLQTDPQGDHRVVISGYLPERAQAAQLDAALGKKGITATHSWIAVDEFKQDLARRLGFAGAAGRLRYMGQGRFMVSDVRANLEQIDPLIRRLLQDLPTVRAIDLRLVDQPREQGSPEEGIDAGSPVTLHFTRADGAPGGVSVTGMEQIQQVQKWHYDVRSVRLGSLSSVVLGDGARYFEGSTLPGGAVLVKIRATHLVVRQGQESRQIELSADVKVADRSRAAPESDPMTLDPPP